ncbi:hypothetical protein SAMN02745121_06619 [Nannocystis exedens]|uniref:Terpene synthase n=1 Tax=Nannocystis exedens TaxID=54 RepID=A0A1I2FGM6_9BACT|nr:hypothetical protein [Nannocystis exedens]PCC70462.1 Germacrene A synthase [Nannocystis exedens]SFF03908.1 hypothetical protein SAMN02745121_06619 [Nannocystis exedens]
MIAYDYPNVAERVELIPAARLHDRAPDVPAAFQLRFPQRWRPRQLLNPHADRIERRTLAWLQTYGIGRDADEREKLRKFNCAMYGGYSLPVADFESALLVTQFICLWLFWDDMLVEEELGWDIGEVVRALTDDAAPATTSRYVAAWADIGRRLRRARSAEWLQRLGATMRQWMENAKLETGLARAFKRGSCPEFVAAFDCRTVSIGMYPTFHLIEHAEGAELPASFHEHPVVVELKRLASRLVGLGNDLGGLAKDIDQRWLNLVLILGERSSLPIESAFARVVALHNEDVQIFDRLCHGLPSWGLETDRHIDRWLRAVRYNVHGFTLWESTAERYQELKAIVGDKLLVAPVVEIHEAG